MSEPGGKLARSADSTSRLTRRDRFLVWLAVTLLGAVLRLLPATYRLHSISGAEHLQRLTEEGRPAILAGWHQGIAIGGYFFRRHLIRKGIPIALLVSLSRDGELLARMATKIGVRVVRGSASRGGLHGLRLLHRLLTRERCSVALAPDGPRGPARECKTGVVLLAQISGVPILPLSGTARRYRRLGSWDRMIVPAPFTRIALAFGEPIVVPPSLSSQELEERSRELGEILDRLTAEAERALGAGPGAGSAAT